MDCVAEFFETCDPLLSDEDLSDSDSLLAESMSNDIDISVVEAFNMSEVLDN